MATEYTGSPTNTQAPGLTPGPGVDVIQSIPQDLVDDIDTASVRQMVEVCADKLAALDSNWTQQFLENWEVPAASYTSSQTPVPGLRWNFVDPGSCTFQISDPALDYYARFAQLSTSTVAETTRVRTSFPLFFAPADSVVCWETAVYGQIGGASYTIEVGLVDAGGSYLMRIYADNGSPNWFVDGDGSPNPTGIPVSLDLLPVKMLWDLGANTINWYLGDDATPTVSLASGPAASLVNIQMRVVGNATNPCAVASNPHSLRWRRKL